VAHPKLLRVGISRCLLGDHVRYDGGHKRDPLLLGTLGRLVEWVPVCPEVEVGLGVPRERLRLEARARSPRLVTISTGVDHTRAMVRFSERRLRELEALDLCGYVFKARSPSCGIGGVPVYSARGTVEHHGPGLFARAFMQHFPLMPVEDEDRLHDPAVREQFLDQVSRYRRWRNLLTRPTPLPRARGSSAVVPPTRRGSPCSRRPAQRPRLR